MCMYACMYVYVSMYVCVYDVCMCACGSHRTTHGCWFYPLYDLALNLVISWVIFPALVPKLQIRLTALQVVLFFKS